MLHLYFIAHFRNKDYGGSLYLHWLKKKKQTVGSMLPSLAIVLYWCVLAKLCSLPCITDGSYTLRLWIT